MKLITDIKDYEVTQSDGVVGGEVSIDTSNLGMFYEMMSKSIYSNPIGSIVRELTSNCFDSHIEAGVTKPVVIKGFSEEGNFWIGFEDFGVGISPQRFQDIYLKYMSSTKRDSNEQLGMWGLGSKSPFSYTDVFYIRTRSNGIEYYYIMSKGQKGIPEWDKLYEKPTEEGNGTLVKFIVEGGIFGRDYHKFRTEIRDQLMYFDNVYVDNFAIDNIYTILEYKTFKFRKGNIEEMHILLGKVKYPIDWNIIGLPEINVPVGIKFDIGELLITPNRESIRYNDDTIAIIKDKIVGCCNELKAIMAEATFSNLDDLITAANDSTKFILLEDNIKIPVYQGNYGTERDEDRGVIETIRYPFSIPYTPYDPFKGTPIRVPIDNPWFFMRTIGNIRNGKYSFRREDKYDSKMPSEYKYVYKMFRNGTPIYRSNDFKINRMKVDFIQNGAIVGMNNSLGARTKFRALGLESLARKPFGKKLLTERPFITDEWNKSKLYLHYKKVMTSLLLENSKSYDRLEIPTEFERKWKEENKAKRITTSDDEIQYYYAADTLPIKHVMKLSVVSKDKLLIYTSLKNKNIAKAVYQMLISRAFGNRPEFIGRPYKFSVINLQLNDFKKMEGKNNVITLENLLNSKGNNVLIEQATALYLHHRFVELDLNFINRYVPVVTQWLNNLTRFMSKTLVDNDYVIRTTLENKFVKDILSTMKESDMFIREYVNLMDGLEFIQGDLQLLKVCSDEAKTFDQEKEVASYFIKKGYKVDPIYVFQPNELELSWMKEWEEYAEYTIECNSKYNNIRTKYIELKMSPSDTRISKKLLSNIINSKEIKPIKLCQVNYPKSCSNKLARTSMLALMEPLSL